MKRNSSRSTIEYPVRHLTIGRDMLSLPVAVIVSCLFFSLGCAGPRIGKFSSAELGAKVPIEEEPLSSTLKNVHEDHTFIAIYNYAWMEPDTTIDIARGAQNLDVGGAAAMHGGGLGSGAGAAVNAVASGIKDIVERNRTGGAFVASGDGNAVLGAALAYMDAQPPAGSLEVTSFSSVTFTGEYAEVALGWVGGIEAAQDTLDEIRAILERDESRRADASVVNDVLVPDPTRNPNNGGGTTEGSTQVLWKGVSDTTGNAVFLGSAEWNRTIEGVSANGEAARLASYANGNRSHWRWEHGFSGAVEIVVTFTDGTIKSYSVPNGRMRVVLP